MRTLQYIDQLTSNRLHTRLSASLDRESTTWLCHMLHSYANMVCVLASACHLTDIFRRYVVSFRLTRSSHYSSMMIVSISVLLLNYTVDNVIPYQILSDTKTSLRDLKRVNQFWRCLLSTHPPSLPVPATQAIREEAMHDQAQGC